MESAAQERQIKCFDEGEHGIFPAVLSCVAGVLGLVMVAAGPWLLLA